MAQSGPFFLPLKRICQFGTSNFKIWKLPSVPSFKNCLATLFILFLIALSLLYGFKMSLVNIRRLESTATCNIPVIDPSSKSANLLIEIHGKLDGAPVCIGSELKFRIDYTTSSLIRKNPKDTFWDTVSCCYSSFRFGENRTFINGPECFAVTKEITKIPPEHENLDIKCRNNESNATVYRDQLNIFRINQTVEDAVDKMLKHTEEKRSKDQPTPSIIVIGLDSVSHANFIRYMTQLHNYLIEEFDAIEFHGHNKVGSGTIANVLAFLTGCAVLHPNDYPWEIDPECELIFEEFNRVGYRTFHFEDTGYNAISLYPSVRHSGKTGTSYNNFDFMDGVRIIDENEMGNTFEDGLGCFDNQYALDIFVDNILDVARTYLDKLYFTFLWSGRPAHLTMRNAQFMDSPIHRLLTQLKSQDLISNTIIFVISDHGPWHGTYLNTEAGRMERLTPLLYVHFPDWFKQKYSLAIETMKLNSRRLTTQYDLYETFKQLVNVTNIRNEVLETVQSHHLYSEKLGQSLFLPVSNDRTCDSAKIPFEYCICSVSTNIPNPEENEDVKKATNFSMDILNLEMKKFPQCAKLKLKKILQARSLSLRTEDSKSMDSNIIQVTFNTYPVDAEFLSTITINSEPKFLGNPLRINEYGKQSKCIAGWKNATYAKSICSCT